MNAPRFAGIHVGIPYFMQGYGDDIKCGCLPFICQLKGLHVMTMCYKQTIYLLLITISWLIN